MSPSVQSAELERQQRELCRRVGSAFCPPDPTAKVGIAANIRAHVMPLNGLRHDPRLDSCGWYFWAGEELSTADDFFLPLHVIHLHEWEPRLVKYLALAPGWRFLTDGVYEDVWYDASLLEVAT
jgi:hypothetical protein